MNRAIEQITQHVTVFDERVVKVIGSNLSSRRLNTDATILLVGANARVNIMQFMGTYYEKLKSNLAWFLSCGVYVTGYNNLNVYINEHIYTGRGIYLLGQIPIHSPSLEITVDNQNAFNVYAYVVIRYLPTQYFNYDKDTLNLSPKSEQIEKVTPENFIAS